MGEPLHNLQKKIELILAGSKRFTKERFYPIITMSPEETERAESASLKKEILSTPGIVSVVASKMDLMDVGFKGLYLLVNDERYRYELEPFVRERMLMTVYIEEYREKRNRMNVFH